MGDKKEKKKSHTEPVGRGNGKIKTNWKGTRGQEHPKQKWTWFFGLERGTWTGASDTKHTRFSYLKARPSKGYVRIRQNIVVFLFSTFKYLLSSITFIACLLS
jgi:hypothetical protein